jgi:drug/metabolite transporter (DMT)-like permease
MLKFDTVNGSIIDLGLSLVFIATIFWGIYTTLIKIHFDKFDSMVFMRNIVIIVEVLLLITVFVTGEITQITSIDISTIIGLFAMALVADVISNITFFIGITNLSPIKANVIFLFAPVIALIASNIVLNESLTLYQRNHSK